MKKIIAYLGMFLLLFTITLVSCKSTNTTTDNTQTSMVSQSGPELWGNNCARCHNSPSPDAYSDHSWTAIVNHMQKVAGLTVSDADKILEFLKSSN